jgi:hypothetical protein
MTIPEDSISPCAAAPEPGLVEPGDLASVRGMLAGVELGLYLWCGIAFVAWMVA